MKRAVLIALQLFLIVVLSCCKYKSREFTLIGKWQLVEQISGNGGGKNYHSKIKNGRTLEFNVNNEVINKLGQKGKYQLDEDSTRTYLKITFPNSEEENYTVYDDDFKKMVLHPVNSEHQLICDCGCTDIYLRK